MKNRLDMKVMGGVCGDQTSCGSVLPSKPCRQARFKLLLAKAPLIYNKWPRVAQIKTNWAAAIFF